MTVGDAERCRSALDDEAPVECATDFSPSR
jgi:hypothetical protein